MTHSVGLDVGTSGVKALAVDERGRVVERVEESYGLTTPRPGWVEQEPEDWWRAAANALRRLEEAAGPPAGIGLSGQMHGLVALDVRDRPVRPAILWNDQRSGPQCAEIEARVGRAALIERTGNRALAGFTAPKLRWVADHEPGAYRQITSVLLPKDYVRLRLCGVRATDVTDASGTLLFDVAKRRWSAEICDAIDVPARWLPPALESPEAVGRTAAGVPVAAGAGDQAAGALGVAVDRPGPASIVLGTSGVVFAALERFDVDAEARAHTFCHAVPRTWHAMGVMLSAAGSLRWLRDVAAPGATFSQLIAEAERWPPGAEGLTFLPYLAGERTPHADPAARGAFAGLGLHHDLGALVRAVLEGVAFGLRDCLDVLRDAGIRPDRGMVSGGGARSEIWLRIVASVLELPLTRVEVDEGAAFGAALLGGVAAGVWRDPREAVAATVRASRVTAPDPEWSERYGELRPHYQALYPAVRACQVPAS